MMWLLQARGDFSSTCMRFLHLYLRLRLPWTPPHCARLLDCLFHVHLIPGGYRSLITKRISHLKDVWLK